MMKGGREEGGKVTMSPLFPRLHVNDAAEKGGPRAPPRNKMALYEQFTVPCQRFPNKSAPSPLVPPPQHISKVVVQPSTSGCGQDGAMFSSYYFPSQLPARMSEEVNSHSFNAKGTKSSMSLRREKSSLRSGAYRSFKLKSDGHAPSSMDSNSLPRRDSKSSVRKRADDDDDFRVPTFVHKKATPSSDKDQLWIRNSLFKKKSETSAGTTCNSSDGLPIISEKPPEELVHISLISRKLERDYSQQKTKETVKLKENFKRPELSEELEGETVEPFICRLSSDCENGSVNIIELEKAPNGRTKIYCESAGDCGANCDIDSQKRSNNSEDAEERESSRVQMSDAKKSPVNFKTIEDEGKEDNGAELLDQKCAKKTEGSETSVLESASGFDISPDEVAGMIGAKHFWKARRVILNQQRVFALQVFELHRLIKVQKLIATSPQILLQGGSFVTRSATVASKNASETTAKAQLLNWEQTTDFRKANEEHVEETLNRPPSAPICMEHGMKDDFQKSGNNEHIGETLKEAPSLNVDECIDETTKQPPSTLPNVEHALNEGSAVQGFRNGNHSGQFSVGSATSENSPTPWCSPPPANQWLIPVMSPSEGLVYKPCMGPYPPSMGFMPPMLGGCGPVAMPPVGDFVTCDFPAPNQQHGAATVSGAPVIAPSFYPISCGFPFANPSVDAGHASSFPGTQPKEQNGKHSGYWGNVVKPRTIGFSANSRCVHASRGSVCHGSMASSPSERLHEAMDVSVGIHMPVQAAESSCQSSQAPPSREQQSRVIKVVPHNPRRATESVARIFKCIQRESNRDSV